MMSQTIASAIEKTIEQLSFTGAVLDVNQSVRTVLSGVDGAADHSYDEVALALIKAASRRQVAMTFHNEEA